MNQTSEILLFYKNFKTRIDKVKEQLGRHLTFTEKLIYSHLYGNNIKDYNRGRDYVEFRPDRVAMQDATAQMTLLQFMNAGREAAAVPSSVHCDHLIQAYRGANPDIARALEENKEVYDFLSSVSKKYGIDFWEPGAGIIHQVVFENYAFPGGMMVGTDSHTPTAGGLGMMAVGVGGADAVDVMAGMPWELRMPEIIGVRLKGKLSGWASPKDIILKLSGMLTVKGGTNKVIEYFGEGCTSLSATGKATVCNMGAEVGATCSVFPFDESMSLYLRKTGREQLAAEAEKYSDYLRADTEVISDPSAYYDNVIEIDLDTLEPYVNGPFTPDAAFPISEFCEAVKHNGWPGELSVGLIGSCTNSSFEDLARAASVAHDAERKNIKPKAGFIINPGSEKVLRAASRAGFMETFEKAGAMVMTNACGPCIGQWKRDDIEAGERNSIVTSFNRNFAKRADGNPNTFAFIASPEIVTAMIFAGRIDFNPLTDTVADEADKEVMLGEPSGEILPEGGFVGNTFRLSVPDPGTVVTVDPSSERLQLLTPFTPADLCSFRDMPLLIKVRGKATTDHISMAGPWLRYRGHLQNISKNLLLGAENAFTGESGRVRNCITGEEIPVWQAAALYRDHGMGSVIVAEENYGEGSSREHAAMEPRYLGVKAIIAKSFARIHETNLKKQGVLALTFAEISDYDKILEGDRFTICDMTKIDSSGFLQMTVEHCDGTSQKILLRHTYNDIQIEWLRAGSALNYLRLNNR